MRRSIIALTTLTALAGLAFATPASANPDTIRIPVTAADLESPEAVATLYQRINEAAASVCVEITRSDSIFPSRAACQRRLVDRALADTAHTPLARHHAEVRGWREPTTLAAR